MRTYEDTSIPTDGDQLRGKDISIEELIAAGALIPYKDTNGAIKLRWKVSTGGVTTVTEASAASIAVTSTVIADAVQDALPGITTIASPATAVANRARRIFIVTSTLVNGALADVELVPKKSGYYGVMRVKYVFMPVAPAGGTITGTFQDEDNTVLNGLGTAGAPALTITAQTVNTQLENVVLTQATKTVNKGLEVDWDTGGGAGDNGKQVIIGGEYWYEA